MEIPITTLQAMLTNAATLGAMSAVKRLDPVKDELKASEVRTWLGNDSKMSRKFDAMVRKGMIKGFKTISGAGWLGWAECPVPEMVDSAQA